MTRDQWLAGGVDALRPVFSHVGNALPSVIHVSVGFPSRGAVSLTKRAVGQCWEGKASKDGNCHVFISPVLLTPVDVLDTLAHELVHVVTPGAKHRGKFITVSHAVGLTEGKPTSAGAGAVLRAKLERIACDLGELPHPPLTPSFAFAKQTTRMVKCVCAGCGYTARTTRKWLEVGAPFCPACGVQTEADDTETIDRLNGNSRGLPS